MAVAVIFGLGFATLLTLILVPVLCSLAHSLRSRQSAGAPPASGPQA
jgi:Cu/Ag efflux pump CusA